MTQFDKDNYMVIKKALEPDIAEFLFNYFMLKRQVTRTFIDTKYISPFNFDYGNFGDTQVPNSFSIYSDTAMETLLLKTQSIMEEQTGLNLIPTYSYARIYEKGDTLHRHKDRYSCEVSTTMNIGGDSWPIFVEPDIEKGKENNDGTYSPGNTSGRKVVLEPGDMHPPHTHSNNILSGVFYLTGGPNIIFQDPRSGASVIDPVAERTIDNATVVEYEALPNRMMIFPAWLPHWVPINKMNGNRISISWNVMLQGKIGQDKQSSTWHDFNDSFK